MPRRCQPRRCRRSARPLDGVCPTRRAAAAPDSRRGDRACEDRRRARTPRLRPGFSRSARKIVRHPLGFAAQTLRAFRANQGLLLAGGVAYYTLLSIVPLMILLVIILSHVIDADRLMATLARYLEIVVPGPVARR